MKTSIKGLSPEWYTLTGEKGEDDPVQFYLQPLDGMQWTSVLMDSYDPETGEIGPTGIVRAFKLGCKGWRNIEDSAHPGQQLKFSQRVMGSLHPAWIMEVGQRVLEISNIDPATAKNSDSPSSSPEA